MFVHYRGLCLLWLLSIVSSSKEIDITVKEKVLGTGERSVYIGLPSANLKRKCPHLNGGLLNDSNCEVGFMKTAHQFFSLRGLAVPSHSC